MKPNRYLSLLIRIAALLLCLAAAAVLVYIYAHGAAALASASYSEKVALSTEIDADADYTDNTSVSEMYSCLTDPVFLSSDGVALSGSNTVIGPAFYNLIGYQAGGTTRYLMDICGSSVELQTYSPLTGIYRSEEPDEITIDLTISAALQQSMYDFLTAYGAEGLVLAVDTATGGILCAVSTPGASSEDDVSALAEGSLLNKCLRTTAPGSTMKILTLVLLSAQGADLDALSYTCTGSCTLQDGSSITCSGVHGTQNAAEAVANSCNAWFAQAIAETLSVSETVSTLQELGFSVNGSEAEASVGEVPASPGSITLDPDAGWSYTNVWVLLGETEVRVSPVFMVRLAAAMASAESCMPCFLTEETGTADLLFAAYEADLAAAAAVWADGFQLIADRYDDSITLAKTGTYEFSDGTQKNLLGVSDEHHIAFFIAFENYSESGTALAVTPADAAAYLMDALEEQDF